jgi:hypothetical protein
MNAGIEGEVSPADKQLVAEAMAQQENEDRRKADLMKLLEHHAAMVESGKIVGLAIVSAHGPDQISFSYGGTNFSTLIAGAQEMASQMRAVLFKKKPSPIIMPDRVQ